MTRTFVMGDPQAPFSKLWEVLEWHRVLDGDRLAADVVLVSVGDHFDYDVRNPHPAGAEGLRFLRWLVSHDPAQVVLLLGNHDASRVMELATISDDEFQRARTLARAIDSALPSGALRAPAKPGLAIDSAFPSGALRAPAKPGLAIDEAERTDGDEAARLRIEREYEAAFPTLPPPGVIGRDYASFSAEQRTLVMELLLAGRFKLAITGVLPDGRAALISHAGVTTRELGMLGLTTNASPTAIAAALEAHLAQAVDHVRDDWQRGELAPMSLAPLHVTGSRGEEGGGLLYHRPSNPDRADADPAWALAPSRPRRFDPRTLPPGLTQIVGHSGHAKCVHELGAWVAPAARARKHGGIRTLRVTGGTVTYDLGVAPPAPGVADLILVDGELRRVHATEVALLPLSHIDPLE